MHNDCSDNPLLLCSSYIIICYLESVGLTHAHTRKQTTRWFVKFLEWSMTSLCYRPLLSLSTTVKSSNRCNTNRVSIYISSILTNIYSRVPYMVTGSSPPQTSPSYVYVYVCTCVPRVRSANSPLSISMEFYSDVLIIRRAKWISYNRQRRLNAKASFLFFIVEYCGKRVFVAKFIFNFIKIHSACTQFSPLFFQQFWLT